MIWTDDLCAKIVEDMQESSHTYASAAGKLSRELNEPVSSEQLRSALRRFNNRTQYAAELELIDEESNVGGLFQPWITNDEYFESPGFPQAVQNIEHDILTLLDPNVLILGDIHAPYHSVDMLERAVDITRKRFPHIKHCMIIGDLFDFSAISNHLHNQPTTSVEVDMRAGGKIARELRRYFELWIGPGNHDERLPKKLNSEFSMESLLCGALGNEDGGLHLTDYDYFYIGDDIIAGHPSLYSNVATGVAGKAALMQKKNVITGHSHKVGITVSADGIHWAIDNGHCANDALFYYARRRLSTFGKMGAGFTIISNNKPFVFGEAITDFNYWRQ